MAGRTGDGDDEEHGDGEDDLHDLPGRALPRHGAQPAPTSLPPWLIPRWTSPTTPPGSVTLRKIER